MNAIENAGTPEEGSIVITTINFPTSAVVDTEKLGRKFGLQTIVVGDEKTPNDCWDDRFLYIPINGQINLSSQLSRLLPFNHYSRKNMGYLLAMSRGAEVIFDTDDDNAPMASWKRRSLQVEAQPCTGTGWVNVYKWYSDKLIWPRGFPLESIRSTEGPCDLDSPVSCTAPIQQGLANGSPDVDAVWRLALEEEIVFHDKGSVLLPTGSWCPFNSQSTWWFPEAYPLMYLPSFVSFRMTDIWRSFIAQRCLWAMGYGLVFHGPEMFQKRNPHNLLRDFEQEIPGYLGNSKICATLEKLELSEKHEDGGSNMYRCYETLVVAGFVPETEMDLVEAWLTDVSFCGAPVKA